MNLFHPRTRPVESLTFIALCAGFDALLCLVSAFLPFSSLLLMLVVPLVSAAVSLFCLKRYIPIYLLTALGVSLGICAFNVLQILFYLIPSLITGAIYGLIWRLRIPSSINLFLSSLLSCCLFFASLALVKALGDGLDMVEVLLTLVGKGKDPYAYKIFPLFAFGYSLAQMALTHLFASYHLERMGISEPDDSAFSPWYFIPAVTLCSLAIGLAFIHAETAYFLFGLGLYWAVFSWIGLYPKCHPTSIVLLLVCLFGGVLLFAGLYSSFPKPTGLVLLSAPIGLSSVVPFLNRFLTKTKNSQC